MEPKHYYWLTAALAVGGLIVSWGFFGMFFMEHGPDLAMFWTNALWTGDGAGLTWDLVFSGFIVLLLAVRDRKTLGNLGVLGVFLVTCILGVCGGLGLYLVLARPTPTQSSS